MHSWSARIGAVLLALFIAVSLLPPLFTSGPLVQDAKALQPPSWQHWFGTDELGRDLLSRVSAGARLSLEVGVGSVVLGLIVALPLGMLAGYFARTWVDEVVMRVVDVVLSLPLFVLAILVLGMTGEGTTDVLGIQLTVAWKVIIVISVSTIPQFARVARSATLIEREEDYVAVLRVIGMSRRRIVGSEILRNVLPVVLVQAFLWMAIAIFAEAGLSFLGLGVQVPNPTLGNLLQNSQSYAPDGAWWYAVFPGAVLSIVILGLNLTGDGLEDWISAPTKLRRRAAVARRQDRTETVMPLVGND